MKQKRKLKALLAVCSLSLMTIGLTSMAQAADRVSFDGTFEQSALIRAQTEPKTKVLLNGEEVKVSPNGKFVFGFEREADLEQTLELIYPDGQKAIKHIKLRKKNYNIQKVNGIAKSIMNPNSAAQKRAVKDSQMVRAARDTFSDQEAFASDFIWPLTGRISGVYGSQRIYNGEPGTPHYGIDIARPTGTPVVAPADGVVTLAVPDMFYSGGTMIIDHGYGVNSTFLHLSKLNAKVGDKVTQGQKVAEVGSTGRSTGAHLDWRLNWYQMRLDPRSIVPPMSQVTK